MKTENTLTQFIKSIKANMEPPYYLYISTYTNSSGLPKLKIRVKGKIGDIGSDELEDTINLALKTFDLLNKDEPVGKIQTNFIDTYYFYITGKCNSKITKISTTKKGEKNEI